MIPAETLSNLTAKLSGGQCVWLFSSMAAIWMFGKQFPTATLETQVVLVLGLVVMLVLCFWRVTE